MPTLLVGFDRVLPDNDAVRALGALLPRNRPCSYSIWPATARSASTRIHRKTVRRSDSGWDAVWEQFISEWTGRQLGESTPSDLLNFLNDLPKLLSGPYSNVAILGPAPRSALSTACVRALRIALLSLKKSRLIWVDLSPHPPKAATLSFSRTLLNSNCALINRNLVQLHLSLFRPETLGVAPPNTLNIFKSTIIWPDGSPISVRAYNIKCKIEVRFAVDAREGRRALITGVADLDSSACWISLRKRHPALADLQAKQLVAVVQLDSLWGLLFPVTDLVFFVFNIGSQVYDDVISKLERIALLNAEKPLNDDLRSEQWQFRGEMLSSSISVGCEDQIKTDYSIVQLDRDAIAQRLDALRKAKRRVSDESACDRDSCSPLSALTAHFKQIIAGSKSIADVPSEIRHIERMQLPAVNKQDARVLMSEYLEKTISILRVEDMSDSVAGVQLQMVVLFEKARLVNSQDPLDQGKILLLQNYAARLSVILAGSGANGFESFLESTLVQHYGSIFPVTLLELYYNLDLHPPDSLERAPDDISSQTFVLPESESFTDAATAGLPESPSSSSKNLQMMKQGSGLLELIAQESCLKRRRTVSCFSSRLENKVKWNRSFSDRDSKRRRSDSNFLILAEAKNPSSTSLQVLVEASPARGSETPQRRNTIMPGTIISESPLFSPESVARHSDSIKDISLTSPPVKRILSFEGF